MTAILRLPLYELGITTASNEDWGDSIGFFEADETTPIAITGIAFRMHLRVRAEDHTVHLEASTANSRLSIGGQSNNILGIATKAADMKIAPGRYVFDLVAIADGHVRRVAFGTVVILQGVTR